MSQAVIGIFGGSGLYEMEGFNVRDEMEISTPFGSASDRFIVGEMHGKKVVFLPRHGRGHMVSAPFVNYRANLFGMKKLGVTSIFSVSAVGSMKEQYHPGHMVFVDQFIDKTRQRKNTFFEDGICAHVLWADPISQSLSKAFYDAAVKVGAQAHLGGSYVCIEGPQLSSRAESLVHRQWGVDVVGMTNATEAKLALEAEISYATMAMITDYDCWHESDEPFSAEKIVQTFAQNVDYAKKALSEAIKSYDESLHVNDGARRALDGAMLTDPTRISDAVKARLDVICGRLFEG